MPAVDMMAELEWGSGIKLGFGHACGFRNAPVVSMALNWTKDPDLISYSEAASRGQSSVCVVKNGQIHPHALYKRRYALYRRHQLT